MAASSHSVLIPESGYSCASNSLWLQCNSGGTRVFLFAISSNSRTFQTWQLHCLSLREWAFGSTSSSSILLPSLKYLEKWRVESIPSVFKYWIFCPANFLKLMRFLGSWPSFRMDVIPIRIEIQGRRLELKTSCSIIPRHMISLFPNSQVLGTGRVAEVGSTVSVHYTGRLLNGPLDQNWPFKSTKHLAFLTFSQMFLFYDSIPFVGWAAIE